MAEIVKQTEHYTKWQLNTLPAYLVLNHLEDTVSFETDSYNLEEVPLETFLEAAEVLKEET